VHHIDLRHRNNTTQFWSRCQLNLSVVAYQSLNSTTPAYISDMLQPVSSRQRQTNLHSATNIDLFVPRTRLRLGERAFSSAAHRLWNALPTNIKRAATCILTFRKKLNTYFFPQNIYAISAVFYHRLLVHIA